MQDKLKHSRVCTDSGLRRLGRRTPSSCESEYSATTVVAVIQDNGPNLSRLGSIYNEIKIIGANIQGWRVAEVKKESRTNISAHELAGFVTNKWG